MIYSFFDAIAPVLQSKGPNSQYVSYSNSRPTVNGYEKYRREKGSYNKYSKVLQGVWKCNLPALLGNYDGPIKQPTDGHESS